MRERNGFKDGDLVKLVSGGPVMTVEISRLDEYVHCLWFDGQRLNGDAFHKDALVRCDEEKAEWFPASWINIADPAAVGSGGGVHVEAVGPGELPIRWNAPK